LSKYPAGGQARRWLLSPLRGSVAAPSPLPRVLCQTRTNRVLNNIPTYLEQVAVLLDENGLVPSLKKMAYSVVTLVECLGVDAV
jgi:hypothetical protein